MQPDMVHDNDRRNSDNDSLFGSPPSSPVRGRSPALALPSGGDCTQNVGTIALPGSHHYSELSVNNPALSLSGFSHRELSQRPPAINPQLLWQTRSRPEVVEQTRPQERPLPARSSSLQSMRGSKKKKSSRENSAVPRPPPPPIHLPNPNVPPPPNFLRNQQALLGLAGLVGGVNPAQLSLNRHPRGSDASNPIVVDDILNPPPLGRIHTELTAIDPSTVPKPSNEEIVASLIKEKNILPVLESILKLIAGNTPVAPKNREQRDSSQGPATKRRRVDTGSVPAGAADWDVPYGDQARDANWERERGKQLITQLCGLIKSAARKAAVKTYQQQVPRRSAPPPPHSARQPSQQACLPKQNVHEPKIMGHYRPITATYGRDGAQIPETLTDNINAGSSTAQTSEDTHCANHTNSQPDPSPHAPTSFNQLVSSLIRKTSEPSGNLVSNDDLRSNSRRSGSVDTVSDFSTPEFDSNVFDNWLSALNVFPDIDVNGEGSSTSATTSSADYDIESLMSATSAHYPIHKHPNFSPYDTPHSVAEEADSISVSPSLTVNTNADFAIDPLLLAMSIPPTQEIPSTTTTSQDFGALPPVPSLTTSPIESNSSTVGPITPLMSGFPNTMGQQGMLLDTVSKSFLAQMMALQDPLAAANTLLQFGSSKASSPSPAGMNISRHSASPSISSKSSANAVGDTQQIADQTMSSVTTSRASTEGPSVPTPARSFKVPSHIGSLRPIPTANKQDILSRARERRRQLVGEIDRAKVELWETTIEQGVLAQLVKEKI